jgi:hypothetical protein
MGKREKYFTKPLHQQSDEEINENLKVFNAEVGYETKKAKTTEIRLSCV